MKKKKTVVLQVCDYAAVYRGNFIESLESLEAYHSNIQNIYLFPPRAKNTDAEKWISEMNKQQEVAYIQEKNYLRKILQFCKIVRKHKVDYIIRHFSDLRIDLVIKLFFSSKKVIRFFHGGYKGGNLLKHRIKKFLWKHNRMVGVSDAIAKEVQRAFPGFSVVSIVNAIQFSRLEEREPVTKPEGISVLMMGWDYHRKGVDLAIKAVQSLQEKYPITLQIIGGINEEAVKALVRQITGGEPAWIRYLPATNNVGTYYYANDIFLSPSRREAFGYANIEAAYCKNSIVLSKVDGQAELQIEGAYWFESENLEEFRNCLEAAILDLKTPEKIAQREQVRQQVQQKYSLYTWSKKVTELLQ
jgi:glycosyltransferase involved in cell wall biosynthesis